MKTEWKFSLANNSQLLLCVKNVSGFTAFVVVYIALCFTCSISPKMGVCVRECFGFEC